MSKAACRDKPTAEIPMKDPIPTFLLSQDPPSAPSLIPRGSVIVYSLVLPCLFPILLQSSERKQEEKSYLHKKAIMELLRY